MKEVTADQGLKLVSLRLPVQVHREIDRDAKEAKRSLNAHLNFLIEAHLEREREAA